MKGKRLRFSVDKISYKTLLIVVVFLLIAILLLWRYVLPKNKAEAAWWNDGWNYRKAISVSNNSGSNQTNTQIKILNNYDLSSLVAAGKAQASLNDLRFTDINGSLLSYWIEDSTNNSVDVWVYVSSLPVSGTVIYMYYGNSSAISGVTKNGSAQLPALSCKSVKQSGNNINTIYYIDPTGGNVSDAIRVYCDLTTDNGGWMLIGKSDSTIYTHAPGFYADGNVPTKSARGSINVFNLSLIDNSAEWAWIDTLNDQYVKFNLTKFNNIKANPDSYTNVADDVGLRFISSNINNTSSLYHFSAVNNVELPVNAGAFSFTASAETITYGRWGTAYYAGGTQSSARIFMITNNGGYEGAYGKYGLQRYNPTPHIALNSALMVREASYSIDANIVPSFQPEESGGGPVAYWKFDEGIGTTVFDSNGVANGGFYNFPTWSHEDNCISGKCISFNGNSGLSVGVSEFVALQDTFSISLWVKPSSISGRYSLLNKSTFAIDNGFSLELQEGKPTLVVNNGRVAGSIQKCNQAIVANKYSHIEIVRAGTSDNKIYINGKECSYSSTVSVAQVMVNTTLGIGSKLNKHNILPNTNYSYRSYNTPYTASCWGGDLGTITYYQNGGYNNLAYKYLNKTAVGTGGCYLDDNQYMQITDNKNYLVSGWLKGNQNVSSISTHVLNINRPSDNNYRLSPWAINLTTNWQRVWWPYNTSVGHSGAYITRNIVYDDANMPLDVYWSGLEVEDVTGTGFTSPSYDFIGFMDEVKIYSYPRSLEQVRIDYASRGSISASSSNLGSDSKTTSLGDGLVAYWKMDEGVGTSMIDYSGNNNIPSLSNISWSAGKYGVGVSFNGVNSFISTTKNFSSTSPYSIVLWAKPGTVMDTGRRNIIVGPGPVWNPGLWVANNIIRVHAATEYRDYAISWNDLSWHMVGQIFDGTTVWTIWDDQVVLGNRTAYSSTTPSLLYLGAQNTTGTAYNWHGLMDEVRYYNRALSPNEVVQLYNFSPGLIGYWNFDEGEGLVAKDLSGNNNGTLQGTTSWKQGKFGSALETNSSATANRMYSSSNNMPINSALTLESWVYPTSYGSEEMTVINGNSAYYLSVYKTGEINCYLYGTSNPGYHGSGAGTVPLNTWTHITCAWDGSNLRIYTNGILKNTVSTSGVGSQAAAIIIGAESTSRQFKGLIDEARIYNYARTQKQIIEDMNAGAPATSSKSILAYYKFDEGQGTTINNWGNGGVGLSGIFGADSSAPTWTNEGKSQKAVSFNGNNEINTSSFSGLRETTWSFWVKPQTSNSQLMFRNLGASDYIAINTSGKAFRLRTFSGSGDILTNSGNLPTNQWSHVAMTYSNPGVKLYLNGKLENQNNTYTLGNLNSYFRIGRYDSNYDGLNGLIDEVKIYNYALTDEEIKQDYNKGSAFSFGSSTQKIGNTTTSLEYCIPGDTSYCAPPVAEYKLDEGVGTTAYDTSGNNNGTVFGATWIQGKIGKALSFDGNDFVGTGNTTSYTSSFTIEGWFKQDQPSGSERGIFTKYVSVFQNGSWTLETTSNGTSLLWDINDGAQKFCSTPISVGQWYFVSAVYTGSKGYLFLNGVQKCSFDVGNINTLNDEIRIGYARSGYFAGNIDHAKIYNYVRTPAQIAWDYNKGGPVGWWKLDECQGNTAYDWSENKNNGTIIIGSSGAQNSLGTCQIGTSAAWTNGVNGKLNSSLNFDGTDDKIDIGNTLSFNSSMSLSAWVFPISNPYTYYGGFLSTEDHNNKTGISLWFRNNKFYFGQSHNGRQYTDDKNRDLNHWYHTMVTYDNGNYFFYLNGEKTKSVIGVVTALNSTVTIGRLLTSYSSYYFPGQLDDVRIYNYALTSEQVKILYNGGTVNFN